ncbi:MAG: SLBB domain-containing protein [Colwellia sp.]
MISMLKKLSTFALIAFSFSSMAQVTQAQIEQFKKLPKAQQQMLAKQMGVDLSSIEAQISGAKSGQSTQTNTETFPRDSASTVEKPEQDEDEALLDGELKPFGYDVFANSPQTFSPTMDIAIPSDYIMGPGDRISIQVYGKETSELELEVNREGQIVFPNHGPFPVAGLSFSEMKQLLSTKIKEKVIGVEVIVGIASLRSMRVFVLGDAFKPGPYNLSSLSSIIHAIFAAGGISDIGSLRNIQLKRAGKLVKTLDLYDLLISGDASNDELLQSGDVIFIAPVGETVSIEGEVRRPAIYELVSGETFSDVVNMAGGLLPSAYAKSSIVERYNTSNLRTVINVDFTDNAQTQIQAQAGDAINVMKAANMFSKSVTLIGAVTRPGKYQWFEGQKLTDILPAVDSHISHNADLNYTLIVREIDVARRIELHQVEIAKAISNPSSEDNITLQANDKVLVFSQVDNLSESKLSLDMFAFTQDDLAEKEKQLVKEKFKTKEFWQKYGDQAELSALQAQEKAKADMVNQSIEQMKGGTIEEEVNIKELTIFSRKRLLQPIISKLKRQGGAGQPIQLIEVDGEVKYPGVYPLAVNVRVDDLILAAGGLNESAYLARAEITRNDVGRQHVTKRSISVDLAAAMQGDEKENVLLQSKDRLNVHQIPAWSENHVVELRGEFVFPGKYTIRRGERLSQLIAKAGGFTSFAHQEGSVFTRIKLQELERQNLIKLAGDLRVEMASKSLSDQNFTQSYAEVQSMLEDLTKLQPVGRLVLDLPRVVKSNEYDVLLEGGDVLYVPTIKNSVNVIGQVQVTSSHIYDERLTAEDYLAQSGGSKKRADEDRIYIISANGSIRMLESGNWFASNSNADMKPGDTVVVPLNGEYMNNLTLWTNVTTIMYNTAVAIAAISGI